MTAVVIVVMIDAVLAACAAAFLLWFWSYMQEHNLKIKDSWVDCLVTVAVVAALIGKLFQWCTSWL